MRRVTRKKLRVGFTYDAKADYKLLPGESPDKYAEFDSEETLSQISGALASGGHEIIRIGHVRDLLKRIGAGERWDIVFNIAEGIAGRNRESQVPLLLEIFDIPYVGSDALSMGMTLDKAVAKMIVGYNGVQTPRFREISSPGELDDINLSYPLIVKPSEEGTSKGISADAIVRDPNQLKKRVHEVLETYHQPALVEEFIAGQEFTVAVVGNETPEALLPVQVAIKGDVNLGNEFYTHERVVNDEIQYLCPSPAPAALQEKLKKMSVEAYRALGIRDFGRIDFRVDTKGEAYFLECNPLPNLGLIDVFPLVAEATGTTYEKLLCRILDYGIQRYGIQ